MQKNEKIVRNGSKAKKVRYPERIIEKKMLIESENGKSCLLSDESAEIVCGSSKVPVIENHFLNATQF